MGLRIPNSEQIFEQARRFLVGGVNSPVRAFCAVGGSPLFIQRAKGARLWDVDGHHYIDYVGSWGPMILGHGHPKVRKAIRRQLKLGTSFGAPTLQEVELAAHIQQAVPSMEKIRLVNSGTEATMSAIRVARGFTGRDKIIKFEGAYHGHADHLLVQAGSGATTHGVPTSQGVPAAFVEHTLLAPYNDLDRLQELIRVYREDIAAVIVEPVCGNMGLVPPKGSFLQQLALMLREHRILLIFDEVMTGFRVAYGGAQDLYGIRPDLTCLGKIIGGGLPVGAYGGRADIMAKVAPEGPVYQAGTLSGNPLAVAAGLATLRELARQDPYHELNERAKQLVDGIEVLAKARHIPMVAQRIGSMFSFFFTNVQAVWNYEEVKACNTERFKTFFHLMLEQGVYLPPSPFEAWFLSVAHRDFEIKKTLEAAEHAFEQMVNA